MYIAIRRLTPLAVLVAGCLRGKGKPPTQTMYLIHVEKSGAEDGLSSVKLMFYNSVLSLPFLFFIIIAAREFHYSLSVLSEKLAFVTFSAILLVSLVMGIVLNFTMFWCTIVNSTLTTTIIVLKGVGSTTLGFVLLGGMEVHTLNVTGLVFDHHLEVSGIHMRSICRRGRYHGGLHRM